jgi:hypothetical protein
MGIRSVRGAVAVALVWTGVLLVAGCSDGGDSRSENGRGDSGRADEGRPDDDRRGTTTAAGPGEASYCEAALALETPPAPEIDFATTTEEQQIEANRTHARETLRPLTDALVAAAPDELAADAGRVSEAVDELATSGDYAVFSQPDVDAARDNLHAYDLENCGWAVHRVTATDHAFDGVPDRMDPGPTSFELSNTGREVHELVLVRKHDDVNASTEEILEMPRSESQEMITEVGYAYTAQGGTDYFVADLEAGDYIGACFVAVGTINPDAPPAQAPPHSTQGMTFELTVG